MLRKLRQEDLFKFQANLGYIVSLGSFKVKAIEAHSKTLSQNTKATNNIRTEFEFMT